MKALSIGQFFWTAKDAKGAKNAKEKQCLLCVLGDLGVLGGKFSVSNSRP